MRNQEKQRKLKEKELKKIEEFLNETTEPLEFRRAMIVKMILMGHTYAYIVIALNLSSESFCTRMLTSYHQKGIAGFKNKSLF